MDQFDRMKERWPSTVLSRSEVKAFTGGLLSKGTLANEDSRGTGPEGAFLFCGKKAYDVEKFVEWLRARANRPTRRLQAKKKRDAQ